MAALPYMPLYVADYLADAAHLSTLGHGAYLLLIMTYWQRGGALPADDRKLARICRLSEAEWAEVRADLAEFFREEAGAWRHKRVEQELAGVRAKSDKARAAGKASAEKRFPGERPASAQPALSHTESETEQKNKILSDASDPKPVSTKFKARREPYPEAFERFWQAYPTDALMSKKQAAAEWAKLAPDKREQALAGCPAFRAHCAGHPDYRPVHACRYLSEERFVGFAAVAERSAAVAKVLGSQVHVRRGTPQWEAWQRLKRTPSDKDGGWWFPSLWPPGAEVG
jgi:uncharacterized protein YdaU (DUF1376 family)